MPSRLRTNYHAVTHLDGVHRADGHSGDCQATQHMSHYVENAQLAHFLHACPARLDDDSKPPASQQAPTPTDRAEGEYESELYESECDGVWEEWGWAGVKMFGR